MILQKTVNITGTKQV